MDSNLDVMNKRILFSGKTNSGKSYLIRYILTENIRNFSKVYLFCPTERVNRFYSKLIPKECIFDEYDEGWLDRLLKHLSKKAEDGEELKPILIIFDDMGSENDMKNSKALQRAMCRGRHVKLNIWQSVQYIYMVQPLIRNQMDYIFCGQGNNQSLEVLTDEFLYGDLTRKEFQKLYHRCTRDYNFLVINTCSVKNSDDINQIYSTIKTPDNHLA